MGSVLMKVSVAMVTYNHEKFIAQALDSILMQKVNFDYEIVIGEDCSPDNTREIIQNYYNQYPGKIRLLLRERNLGFENWTQTLMSCQGQYIALLEGDDYWTSPHKLQKQVEFLDSHPECTICFHPVLKVYEGINREPGVYPRETKPIYRLTDLLEVNFIPTCSTMFRRGLFGDFPAWYYKLPYGDWPLHILNAQQGDIGCLDEVMAAYRNHGGGAWSKRSPAQKIKSTLDIYERVNAFLNYEYESRIMSAISKHWERLADEIAEAGLEQRSLESARDFVKFTLENWPDNLPITKSWKSSVWGRTYAVFAFAEHKSAAFRKVRSYWVKALQYDQRLLLNRGFISIGIDAFLGRRIGGVLKWSQINNVKQIFLKRHIW
jgi:glycosyltransferase involved in cell wall biosynthesis